MEKYAFFRGCLIPVKFPQIESLTRKIFPKLDIELIDLDFTCCPSSSVRDFNEFAWLVIAARNLAVAEENKLNIVTLCNGCVQTLIEANELLCNDKDLLKKVNEELQKINKKYNGSVEIKHFLSVLYDNKENIKKQVKKELQELRIAGHTGCHLLRPSSIIKFDNAEDPKKLDELIKILGVSLIDYPSKTLCCGNALFSQDKNSAFEVMKDKFKELNEKNTDALVVVCPSCFQQFDRNQKLAKLDNEIPVLYYLQLLGLAMSFSMEEIGYEYNKTKSQNFEEKLKNVLEKEREDK